MSTVNWTDSSAGYSQPGTEIVIVGGSGTFGLSTAHALVQAGYCSITCLDRWPVPSPSSAGYDMNKIMRTEYASEVYTRLAHEALSLWREPLYSAAYHETGWIFCTNGTTELGRVQAFDQSVENTKKFGDASNMIEMEDWDDTLAKFPFLDYDKSQSSNIDKRSFRAVFNRNAGWVDPVIAMQRVRDYCKHHGVRFISGDRGTIVNLIRDNEGRVTGVEAKDGTKYTAGRVILAMGAYSDTLLDYESQLEATAYVVSHVKLTEEQYQKYKNMPVINMSRRGYIFPPKEDRILKVCNTDTSYLNSESSRERNGDWGSKSTPRDPAYHPTDTQPTHGKDVTQWFLKNFLPELASGQLHSSRLCWDAEAHDYSWIIGTHPSSPDSLYIATGGSGHSFKNFVNVGKYVVQMMDGKLDEKLRDLWRWRPDRVGVDLASEERPRRPKIELKGAEGWNHDEEKET